MRLRLILLIALLLAAPGVARATQMAIGTAVAPQIMVSHADVSLTANASAVTLLPTNLDRVEALCRMVPGQTSTNVLRIGDSTSAASTGYPMTVGDAITMYETAPVYGYSTTGATVNCSETVRPRS